MVQECNYACIHRLLCIYITMTGAQIKIYSILLSFSNLCLILLLYATVVKTVLRSYFLEREYTIFLTANSRSDRSFNPCGFLVQTMQS